MNKPYQSIALELYTKLPYELDKNILIKIMKEVKKKELHYYPFPDIFDIRWMRSKNIFKKINKRSYNIYLLKKIFNRMKKDYIERRQRIERSIVYHTIKLEEKIMRGEVGYYLEKKKEKIIRLYEYLYE